MNAVMMRMYHSAENDRFLSACRQIDCRGETGSGLLKLVSLLVLSSWRKQMLSVRSLVEDDILFALIHQ